MDIVVDQVKIHASTGGRAFDPGRPCIIFLHGAGCDQTSWTLPARWYAHHGWSVVAPDLPGHGRSGGAALGSVAALAAWVWRLADAMKIDRAALVGHSMGGAVAIEASALAPARTSHLGLIGTAAQIPVGPALLETAGTSPQTAYDMMTAWGHSTKAKRGGSQVPGIWMAGATRAVFDRNAAGVLANDLRACNVWKSGAEAAAQIDCPTVVVCGALDVMTPAKRGRELAAAIKDSVLSVIADCGHMIMSEAPDACLDALIATIPASMPVTAAA